MIYEDKEQQDDADSITLLRILDTLYAIGMKIDEAGTKRLIDKHNEGGLIGPTPQVPDTDNML